MLASSAYRQNRRRIEKVRGGVRVVAVAPQKLRQPAELLGRLLGHLLRGLAGAQRVRVGERLAQDLQPGGFQQIFQRQIVRLFGGVGEVGVDDDALHVADDEQRRVEKGLAILEELGVGLIEVGVLTLVLPGEMAHLPDVGPALAAGRLARARLEGEPLAGRISLGRRRVANQPAQVDEVLLGRCALAQRGLLPLGDEGLGGDGWRHWVPQPGLPPILAHRPLRDKPPNLGRQPSEARLLPLLPVPVSLWLLVSLRSTPQPDPGVASFWVAAQHPISPSSGLSLPQNACDGQRAISHEVICSRASFITSDIIKLIVYRNACCKRSPICR